MTTTNTKQTTTQRKPTQRTRTQGAAEEGYRPDWGTRHEHLAAVREVFGGAIELDVCSSALHNETVRALRYFTAEENALDHDWRAQNAYCNPPGGRGKSGAHDAPPMLFWQAMQVEVQKARDIGHAIFCAFSLEQLCVSARVPGVMPMTAYPICYVASRVEFVDPTGSKRADPQNASAFVYLPGEIDHTERFANVFSQFGAVVVPDALRGEDQAPYDTWGRPSAHPDWGVRPPKVQRPKVAANDNDERNGQ